MTSPVASLYTRIDPSHAAYTHPKIKNPKFDQYPKYLPGDNFIQRGYMRVLGENFEATGDDLRESDVVSAAARQLGAKLNFQFNPNNLTRAVQARTDTQLWINQSPSQLLMPGIGDMSFSWQMLFNREAEVQNNPVGNSRTAAYWLEQDDFSDLAMELKKHGTDAPEVAARVGVLADIMVLDRITGQKLSPEAYEYSKAYAQAMGLRDLGDDTEEPDENAVTIANLTGEDQASLLSANMNNSAFLIPNPIRVVFSENFMVDGYVNSVTVSLQKFSPEMVPTVATVDISMHAIYQGFTRKTTVFTELARLMADAPDSPSINPVGEDIRRAADDENDDTHALQDFGYDKPGRLFTGFDHSPKDTGEWSPSWGPFHFGTWPTGLGDPATHLIDHRIAEGGRTSNNSQLCQIGNDGDTALTYAFASAFQESAIGRHLVFHSGGPDAKKNRDQNWSLLRDRLSGDYWVGFVLRARLRARGSDDDAKLANLKKLWEDGGEAGFTTYENNKHFFGGWSTERRNQMFAVGIDNFYTPGGFPVGVRAQRGVSAYLGASQEEKKSETEGQSSGFYTRSFPITELSANPGHYGDEFYRVHGEFETSDIQYKVRAYYQRGKDPHGWLWLADRPPIKADQFRYNLARGFYTPLLAGATPLPETLTLTHTSNTPADDVVFDIEYQWVTTFRVRVEVRHSTIQKWLPVSDTGVVWVYARDDSSHIIDRISDTSEPPQNPLNAGPAGTLGSDIETAMKDGYWIKGDDLDTHLHFDALHGHVDMGVTEKLKQEISKLYADAKNPDIDENPRLGGMSISKDGVYVDRAPSGR